MNWFYINLGDAMLAHNELASLKKHILNTFNKAGNKEYMAAFVGHISGELHCSVFVYINTPLQQRIKHPTAHPCAKPQAHSLMPICQGQLAT